MAKIVLVDDELTMVQLVADFLREDGHEILQRARTMSPPAVVIVITGFGSIETAVEAMKNGAFDYLEKPFKLDELRLCVQRALNYNDVASENVYLKKQLGKKYRFNQMIGTSPAMQDVLKMIEKVADLSLIHISEPTRLLSISYAVFCLKK